MDNRNKITLKKPFYPNLGMKMYDATAKIQMYKVVLLELMK